MLFRGGGGFLFKLSLIYQNLTFLLIPRLSKVCPAQSYPAKTRRRIEVLETLKETCVYWVKWRLFGSKAFFWKQWSSDLIAYKFLEFSVDLEICKSVDQKQINQNVFL